MKQPELGKKIAELRKAKGLTQEELVSKCKLTVRSLQRIESGLVTPRNYTLRMLFTALDYTIYNFSESDSDERVKSTLKNETEQFYKSVINLFNLKTNTMKKISILSALVIILSLSLILITSETKAQKSSDNKFITSNGRGIVYRFPKSKLKTNSYISNIKDTADYKIGKYLIQEYKNKIFLNKKFVARVLEGDTVILDKGRITIKKSYWEFNPSPDNGIKYFIPANLMMDNYSHWADTNTMIVGKTRIKEYNNKIFLNGTFIGLANKGDTVILKNGSLTLRKAQ